MSLALILNLLAITVSAIAIGLNIVTARRIRDLEQAPGRTK